MEQNQNAATKSGLRTALFVAVIIALAAGIFAIISSNRATALESQLDAARQEKDSLLNVIAEQGKLLEAEGDQFQNDLLKIDSLENSRK
jgi:hypothetical protein